MVGATVPQRTAAAAALRVLVAFDTVALLFAGVVHLVGAHIPLGVAVFDEPPLIAAGIVESAAGLIFAVAAFAVFAGRTWSWGATLTAHLFAIAGFLLGIWATRGGTTPFNHDYHYLMLAIFVVGLALLLVPGTRTGLGRDRDGLRDG